MKILEDIARRVKEAKENLEVLNTLILVAKEAGEDVTQYEIQRDNLKQRIERWEKALSKRIKVE